MSAIVISIVIATRNRRRMLSEAIASIHDQSMSDWELIIVDDASTDDTREFLRRQSDPRISWLVSDRQIGQPAAFNQALPRVRGAYVMFMDDDDLLRHDTLERLKGALEAQPHA